MWLQYGFVIFAQDRLALCQTGSTNLRGDDTIRELCCFWFAIMSFCDPT